MEQGTSIESTTRMTPPGKMPPFFPKQQRGAASGLWHQQSNRGPYGWEMRGSVPKAIIDESISFLSPDPIFLDPIFL